MAEVELEEIDAAEHWVARVRIADFDEDEEYECDQEEEGRQEGEDEAGAGGRLDRGFRGDLVRFRRG